MANHPWTLPWEQIWGNESRSAARGGTARLSHRFRNRTECRPSSSRSRSTAVASTWFVVRGPAELESREESSRRRNSLCLRMHFQSRWIGSSPEVGLSSTQVIGAKRLMHANSSRVSKLQHDPRNRPPWVPLGSVVSEKMMWEKGPKMLYLLVIFIGVDWKVHFPTFVF